MQVRLSLLPVILCLVAPTSILAAQDDQDPFSQIPWQKGPGTGQLGSRAVVHIPEKCLFTGKDHVNEFLELTENIPQGNELGAMVCREGEERFWAVFFSFDDVGYVKDDEKDQLDADKLLTSLKEGTEEANKERAKKGWGQFHIVGWERPPYYDANTHNLTWAIRGEDDEHSSGINHNVRLLGRRGVLSVELVASPDMVATSMPTFETIVSGFSYTEGQRYSEWRQGDKIAKYGLTALVAGGAGALAVKSGLLGKLWKVLVAGVAAAAAAIRKLFGRKSSSETANA